VRRPRLTIGLALFLPLLTGAAPPPPDGAIIVDVSGIRSDKGMVRVSVCPRPNFLGDCPWFASVPARIGAVSVTVPDVPPGRYAVQAFHDADSDGKLQRYWFGLPREGIGFSNDAMAHITYPRFSVAAFDHAAVAQHVAITVRYFLR
jgi:uncharacterized protein (DUF2141 family)